MIDFSLDADAAQAVDIAQRFAREHLVPHRRAVEAARALPPDVQAQAAAIGFATLDGPVEHGGAGLGTLARMQVLEALAAGDAGAALAIDRLAPAADALRAFGADALVARHLQPVLESGGRAALVFDDRGALRVVDGRVRGLIPWLPADRIELLIVLDREHLTILREGLAPHPVPGGALQAAGASRWNIDAPIAGRLADASAAATALARARLQAAALMVGTMRAACEQSRDYALDRVAFGKPIAHHQALAFLIVDMRMAVDAARALLHEAAWRADAGEPFAAAAAAAFVEAAEAAMFVGPNAVQIYGAAGFMRDGPVEKPMRELRSLSLLYGGVDAAKDDAFDPSSAPFLADELPVSGA